MELDDTITRVKQLIAQRENIDAELATIFGGTAPPKRRAVICSICNTEGHTARSCPSKPQEGQQ